MKRDRIIFLIYPTWFCNFKCPYCVASHLISNLGNREKKIPSMFDAHSTDDWIKALSEYGKIYDIEIYLSGGDPLCINQTYGFLAELVELPFVKYIRLDHNMSMVTRLLKECHSEKIQINGSWHPLYLDYPTIYERACMLKEYNMIAMINYVASKENETYLCTHHLDLDRIVDDFSKKNIFINIATDIHRRNDDAYNANYARFVSPSDHGYLTGELPSFGAECMAAMNFFTVEWDGAITTCKLIEDDNSKCSNELRAVGDFFQGTLERKIGHCGMKCSNCIVMYVQRLDNAFQPEEHLSGYRQRTEQWRSSVKLLRRG